MNSPFISWAILQAYSTTSSPRATSPAASLFTLPCSLTIRSAKSLEWATSSSRNANKAAVRLASDVARHPGKAAFAAATAASTSSTDAKSTSPLCTPVAGLKTFPRRSASPTKGLPSIQCVIRFMGPPGLYLKVSSHRRARRQAPASGDAGSS